MTTPGRRRGAPPAGERLTRDKVLDRATELIERDGVPAFSLRSLAKELDVRPAALYNHVDGLDDLLTTITTRFLAGFDLTEADEPWPDWVCIVASGMHRRMLARPELTGLMLSRAPMTAAGPALMRRFLDRLVSAGVSRATAHIAWHTVLTVVIGSVQQERARHRKQEDTFQAVLTVAVNGLVTAAAGPPDDQALALLDDHPDAALDQATEVPRSSEPPSALDTVAP
ncbi:TetR/AcrR family transcriptional regulator [Amycolatopsis sp. OK19-0408]|uniref:TetR/AcrR family transcriptional regulator n=1 Tax=Amycolatopsis iheyensis TaxID=2945988 RepID=A0A9X2NJI8_9PSEU|nr:TetR/AcrR family transcriptional regulator [Amycolatopsis iheyensis]MCR6488937.1 TetR/AcrR family transcriptional regulator [Amycolatopsis iheyensis]